MNIKQFPYQKYHTTWIVPVSSQTRPMEAQMETSDFFFSNV